jgi:hypothetical protein
MKVLTKTQLRAALRAVPNKLQFAKRWGVPYRTLMRMQTKDASPTLRTREMLSEALESDRKPRRSK